MLYCTLKPGLWRWQCNLCSCCPISIEEASNYPKCCCSANLVAKCEMSCIYELHERLGWDTLATRVSKALVPIIYCCIHNESPLYLYDCLKPIVHQGRCTRDTEVGNLLVPSVNTKLGMASFGLRIPTKWNATKAEIKAAAGVNQMKRLLQTRWYAWVHIVVDDACKTGLPTSQHHFISDIFVTFCHILSYCHWQLQYSPTYITLWSFSTPAIL